MKARIEKILEKQARWQKSRKTYTWGEKIRQVERVRETLGSYGYRSEKSLSLR